MSGEYALLERVVSVGYLKEFNPGHVQFSVEFTSIFLKSTVGSQYFTSTEVKLHTKNVTPPMAFTSWMAHMKVDILTRGSNKPHTICFLKNLINCSLTVLVGGYSLLCNFGKEGKEMDY